MIEKLNPGEIKQNLHTELIASDILVFDTISSTQDYIFDNLHSLKKGTVVLADTQEKGRGRLGRLWYSPPGTGIYMSILFPDISIPEVHSQISLFTSLTLTEFLDDRYKLPFKVRWPNDIMVNGFKIAGVLGEQRYNTVVVGVGLNVNNNTHQLVEGASSLYLLTGQFQNRNTIVADFLNHYGRSISEWKEGRFEYIRRMWLNYTSLKGKPVRAQVDSRFIEGVVEDLDSDCSLVIRNSHGYLLKIPISNLVMIR